MRSHGVPTPVGDALDRGFERRVLEWLDLPAVVAHEMVVMVAAGVRRLEARDSIAEVDPLDQPELVHAVERAVHARDSDSSALRPDAFVNLVRGEATVLLAEQLDDASSRTTASPACLAKSCEGDLRPGHLDNDTRSQRSATFFRVRVLAIVIAVLVLAGCGSSGEDFSLEPRVVVASFYPLAWATERVARDSTEVVNLTPPGVEPHDIELSPSDIETIRDAELVVYIGGGFQPALEDAVDAREGRSLDLLKEGEDPHIWLDPVRFAQAVERIARGTGGAGSAYDEIRSLKLLDAEYRSGLADCDHRVIVTTHAAFGGLAARYRLTQLSLAGRSPESEPGPRELEELLDRVRASGATTVFVEPLVSDDVAQTVAREAGAEVATLDPIEGLSEERLAAGEDYLSVMRSNLAALRQALRCR
jgi:zinc transport system substrate-binding protein